MTASSISPMKLNSKLSKNPTEDPRFKVTVSVSGKPLVFADPRATRALIALMDMQAVLGGAASHWGGPSAFAELMAATWGLMFEKTKNSTWFDSFRFVNDAGHCENGLYALYANYGFAGLTLNDLKGFRSISSPLTGHGEYHVFPEAVLLSNGPLGSALPQAQGLCAADRLARAPRTTVVAVSDGACMEGEAKEALAAIPGLAQKNRMNPFVMIISDNKTKLTGRIEADAFSMAPTFESLKSLGWHVIELKNPHDLQAAAECLNTAFQQAEQDPTRPIAIHAHTVKGYGVQKTAASSSGGHGFPVKDVSELRAFLNEIYQNAPLPVEISNWCSELESAKPKEAPSKGEPSKKEKVQVGISRALIAKRLEGKPVISVSADLPGSTGVGEFQKRFPEAVIDVGVAEANMISMAAGLAKSGYIPVVDTFAQFGVTKGALPLTMAALSEAPVIAIFSHAGFQDAADGASHQALSYFAQVGALPHTEVYQLTSSFDAEALVSQAIDDYTLRMQTGTPPPSRIFFLGREDFAPSFLPEGFSYKLGQAQVIVKPANAESVSSKQKVLIIATGPLVKEAIAASEKLKERGILATVANPSIINRPDVATLGNLLEASDGVLMTVEDHQKTGGMAGFLIPALTEAGYSIRKLRVLGVENTFGRSAYKAQELYHLHGLDAEGILTAALKMLG